MLPVIALLFAANGHSVSAPEPPMPPGAEQVLVVKDMNCPVCPLNVRDALNALPGVRVLSIRPTDPEVRLHIAADGAASEAQMLRAVRRAGHRAYFPLAPGGAG